MKFIAFKKLYILACIIVASGFSSCIRFDPFGLKPFYERNRTVLYHDDFSNIDNWEIDINHTPFDLDDEYLYDTAFVSIEDGKLNMLISGDGSVNVTLFLDDLIDWSDKKNICLEIKAEQLLYSSNKTDYGADDMMGDKTSRFHFIIDESYIALNGYDQTGFRTTNDFIHIFYNLKKNTFKIYNGKDNISDKFEKRSIENENELTFSISENPNIMFGLEIVEMTINSVEIYTLD